MQKEQDVFYHGEVLTPLKVKSLLDTGGLFSFLYDEFEYFNLKGLVILDSALNDGQDISPFIFDITGTLYSDSPFVRFGGASLLLNMLENGIKITYSEYDLNKMVLSDNQLHVRQRLALRILNMLKKGREVYGLRKSLAECCLSEFKEIQIIGKEYLNRLIGAFGNGFPPSKEHISHFEKPFLEECTLNDLLVLLFKNAIEQGIPVKRKVKKKITQYARNPDPAGPEMFVKHKGFLARLRQVAKPKPKPKRQPIKRLLK
ncbi:hypothetical protein JXB01_02385 [Candidatus Micrarchaeota archaeon]|nr:hypothetical protein [Candidatus Micrarchaeota archaeon]